MKRLARLLWGLGLASFLTVPLIASGPVTHLPISAFLDKQEFPVVWTDNSNFKALAFDLFGVRAAYFGLNLGTEVTGDIAVRPLTGGQVHVAVDLHTKSALCWGFQYDEDWATRQLTFGYAPPNVDAYHPPSLGDGTTHIEFTMPSGTDLPSLEVLGYSGPWVLESVQTDVSCTGQFRAASGYPEGTPAAAHTTQVVLYATGVPSGCPPEKDADCAPTEIVRWWPSPRR